MEENEILKSQKLYSKTKPYSFYIPIAKIAPMDRRLNTDIQKFPCGQLK